MNRRLLRRAAVWAVAMAVMLGLPSADTHADSTPQTLPFSQNWSNAGLITTDDNWNGVPGIIGYRGDGLTGGTGIDPSTVLGEGTPVSDVNANRNDPNTFTTGGVTEFDGIANPTVALQGSGTARAPHLVITLNTTGFTTVHVAYNLRDIDGSADNSVQPVALQYRIGTVGNYTNLPAGFVADASSGPSLATKVTAVSVDLPANANNQPVVQVRIITTDAVGSDEWIGIDDISITGTTQATSTNPSGAGTAQPNPVVVGGTSLLTVTVTPGANPASTGIQVSADLSSIGGPSTQAFADDGGNRFSFQATVMAGTAAGAKTLPVAISDAQRRTGPASISLTVNPPPPPVGHPVISQIYGGGGNSGAAFQNDFVELYNPGTAPFDLTGWSVQYAPATGTFSANLLQPLAGPIAPGEYYLVEFASGGSVGAELPVVPNVANLSVNMSQTAGKVALVRNSDPLTGGAPPDCPSTDPDLIDFVGYGTTANCHEGAANAPAPSSSTAVLRKNGGAQDTDNNGNDFVAGTPDPRRTSLIAEIGPFVQTTDPPRNGINAPRDSSVTVTFSEDVSVDPGWFHVACGSVPHDDATVYGGPRTFVITPNVNFVPGEQCMVTLHKDSVHDVDIDDSAPNTDTLAADFTWTFTVASNTPAPYPPEVHLTMGNPSGAAADLNTPDNYLMEKPEFALSYNRDLGRPNWVSWHLDTSWFGTLTRVDTFRPDPAVPPDWYRVQATDFFSTGFDRGHMTPNADRDSANSIVQATFLMSNMVAQAPDNNQGPWANLENYLRTLANAGDEIYIVSGPVGTGGTGSNGFATTLAGGHVTVPAYTWKVALVLPKDAGDDVSRVSASTRTIAVIMPNVQGIKTSDANDWQNYLTTVDAVEALTGYDLFSNVDEAVQNAIEAGTNGVNPPGVANQIVTADEDTPKDFTLRAVSASAGPLIYFIDSAPTHGAVTVSGSTATYAPVADFAGTDSFTFHVGDGARTSNTATVTVRVLDVNDPPTAGSDAKTTDEDVPLIFAAADLTANDSAGPTNEAGQSLIVTSVGNATHGTVELAGSHVTYLPEPNFNGTAAFTYQVCDDGLSDGVADPKCATGTVTVAVTPVNDPPVLTSVPTAVITPELSPYTFTAQATDADGQALAFSLVGAPAGAAIDPVTGQFLWTPTEAQGGTGMPYPFKVRVSDGIATADADVVVAVTEVNVAPTLSVASHYAVSHGQTLTFAALGSDADIPAQALTYGLSGAVPAGAAIDAATGGFTWTPTAAQTGSSYAFNVLVTDGLVLASAPVTIDVVDTTPPTLALPSDITTEATGATTAVAFTATANDLVDGAVTPSCTPGSGFGFPVGTTGVHCTATDAHGNAASGSFAVTLTDQTPPTLTLPGNLTAVATTPTGAVVAYSASASDLVDGTRPVVCAPASGSTFAIGVTTVSCSASDAHGNTATGSFTVTVTTQDVPGRMVGGAVIEVDAVRHEVEFVVQERSTGADAGLLRYELKTRKPGRDQEDRFESAAVTSVSFFNVPGVSPGKKPPSGIDTVSLAGVGRWNGHAGYTFEAVATDAGEPGRGRDSFKIAVRDGAGHVVASVDAKITEGNIQSLRIAR